MTDWRALYRSQTVPCEPRRFAPTVLRPPETGRQLSVQVLESTDTWCAVRLGSEFQDFEHHVVAILSQILWGRDDGFETISRHGVNLWPEPMVRLF